MTHGKENVRYDDIIQCILLLFFDEPCDFISIPAQYKKL